MRKLLPFLAVASISLFAGVVLAGGYRPRQVKTWLEGQGLTPVGYTQEAGLFTAHVSEDLTPAQRTALATQIENLLRPAVSYTTAGPGTKIHIPSEWLRAKR
jgi:hypothetical protein